MKRKEPVRGRKALLQELNEVQFGNPKTRCSPYQGIMYVAEDGGDLTKHDFQKLEKALVVAKESVLAADCYITL